MTDSRTSEQSLRDISDTLKKILHALVDLDTSLVDINLEMVKDR